MPQHQHTKKSVLTFLSSSYNMFKCVCKLYMLDLQNEIIIIKKKSIKKRKGKKKKKEKPRVKFNYMKIFFNSIKMSFCILYPYTTSGRFFALLCFILSLVCAILTSTYKFIYQMYRTI